MTSADEPTPSSAPPEPEYEKEESRRRIRRSGVFLGLVLFGVLSVFATLNTRFGTAILVSAATRFLFEKDEAPFLLADLDIDFLNVGLRMKNLIVVLPKHGNVQADEIYIEFQPLQLITEKLIVQRLHLRNPRVVWNLAPANRSQSPDQTQPSAEEIPELPNILVKEIRLTRGALTLMQGETRIFDLQDLGLATVLHGTAHKIQFESGRGFFQALGHDVPIHFIHAKAGYADKSLNLEKLSIFLPGTDIQLSGTVSAPKELGAILNLELDLPLPKLNELFPDWPKLNGTAKLNAELHKSGTDLEAEGTLVLRDGAIDVFHTEDMDLRFRVNRKGAWLDGSVLNFAKGTIDVDRAQVLFKDNYPIDVTIRLHKVELSQIIANVTDLNCRVQQWNEGTVHMAGTLAPFRMEGDADLVVLNHLTHSGGYKAGFEGGTRIVAVPHSVVKLKLRTDPTHFEMYDGTVTSGHSSIYVKTVNFDFSYPFHMEYESNNLFMEDAGPIVGLDMKGHGSVSCVIDVWAHNVNIKGSVDMEGFEVEGFRLGKVTTTLHYNDKNNVLQFDDITGNKNGSIFHAGFKFNFNHNPIHMAVDVATDDMKVHELLHLIGYDQKLGDMFSGRFAAQASMSGPIGNFTGEARMVFPQFTWSLQKSDTAVLESHWQNNKLHFDRIEVKRGSSRLFSSGELTGWSDLDLRFHSEGLSISDLDFLSTIFKDYKGSVDIQGRVSGSLKDPVLIGEMNWSALEGPEGKLGASEIHAELSPEHIDIHTRLFGKQIQSASLIEFAPVDRAQLEISLNRFQYSFLVQHLLNTKIEKGIISGEIKASTPIKNLRRAEGRAEISLFSGTVSGIDLENERPAILTLEKGLFRLEPFRLRGKGVAFDLGGDIDMDQKLSFTADGLADWRLVAAKTDLLDFAEGPLRFNVAASGKWDDLRLNGEGHFEQSTLKFKELEAPLVNTRGLLRYEGDRLVFEQINFDYLGGRVALSGSAKIPLKTLELAETALRLDVERVPFTVDDGMTPLLSGQVSVSGKPWPLLAQGQLHVDELQYTRFIQWQKKLLIDSVVQALKPKKRLNLTDKPPRLKFDIDILSNNSIRIRNNLAKMDLSCDLKLVGSDKNPGLLNTISGDRGVFFFQKNQFETIRFMVEFVDTDRIFPRFDIAGETTLRYLEEDQEKEVKITLEIKGDLDNPEILLSSDSGMNYTDILSMLVVGAPATSFTTDSGGGMATGLNALSDIAGVDQQIRENLKLDEFRLTSDYSSTSGRTSTIIVPKLVIGKELAEGVLLTYTTALGEQQNRTDQQFELKYRYKFFTISGEWDSNSVEPQGNFGADLKFHFEF